MRRPCAHGGELCGAVVRPDRARAGPIGSALFVCSCALCGRHRGPCAVAVALSGAARRALLVCRKLAHPRPSEGGRGGLFSTPFSPETSRSLTSHQRNFFQKSQLLGVSFRFPFPADRTLSLYRQNSNTCLFLTPFSLNPSRRSLHFFCKLPSVDPLLLIGGKGNI